MDSQSPVMHTSLDQTLPLLSRFDRSGADRVRSSIDWCARCSKRLASLDPTLSAEQALDLAHELSLDEALRRQSPELVAEQLCRVDAAAEADAASAD